MVINVLQTDPLLNTRFLLFYFVLTTFLCSNAQDDVTYYKQVLDTTTNKQTKLVALDSILSKTLKQPTLEFPDYLEDFVDMSIDEKAYYAAIDWAVKGSHNLSIRLQSPNRTLQIISKVEPLLDSIDDSYLKGGVYIKKAGALFNKKDYENAIVSYDQGIANYSNKDSIKVADALYFKGQAKFQLGEFLEAIREYEKAYEYYNLLGDEEYARYTEGAIISVYGRSGFHEKTIVARNQLIDKLIASGARLDLIPAYFNQSINYGEIGNFAKQEEFLLLAHKEVQGFNENLYYNISVCNGLVRFYCKQNKLEKAKIYLNEASNYVAKIPVETIPVSQYKVAKSEFLYSIGQYEDAFQLLNGLITNSSSINQDFTLKQEARELMYKIYEAKGNHKMALETYKSYTVVEDSLLGITKTNALSYYQSLFEAERNQKEINEQQTQIDILNKDKEIAQGKSRLLWLLIIALLLFAAGIVIFIKQKAKQNRTILQVQLDANKREIEVFTKELVEKSNSLDLLKIELEKLKNEFGGNEKIERLQELVSLKILTNEHWQDFKNKFNVVYPSLLVKAREVNKDITNSEERLIALEKLNLKTSEIANILGVSPESVVKIRYRLRKKLGISKETSILQFIEIK